MTSQERMSKQLTREQNDSDRGQVNRSAAQVYEEYFLPALFQQWTGRMAESAQIKPGQRVLDVACGTGVLAREIAQRIGTEGRIAGLDINEGMLEVARQQAPEIEWRKGEAESMPFEEGSFDAVVSQFGLMFFVDRPAALREMIRVLRPNGTLAVAVWDRLDHTPGYAAMVDLLDRLFGNGAADALRAPFNLGDQSQLRTLFQEAGIANANISTYPGTARFPSIESWVYTDVKGWTFADMIDEAQYAQLLDEARIVMKPFVQIDGSIAFDAPAHIVTATR